MVYAHRGGAALAPENTMAAFENGMSLGADGLEFDVRLSSDGVPMVHHDPTVDRTTDGRGPVAELTADQLEHLDAGCKFADANGAFPFRGQGIGVPRFEDVVRRFPDAPLIVEMKDDSDAIAEAVLDVLKRSGTLERAILASFYERPIFAVRRLAPEANTGASSHEVRRALYGSWAGLSPKRPAYKGFQIPEKSGALRIVSPRFVRAMKKAGLTIAVWTVNEEADMRRLLDWGVDGLITDRPDVAVKLVSSVQSPR